MANAVLTGWKAEQGLTYVRLYHRNKPVMTYHFGPCRNYEPWRMNYIHPVHGLSGAVLTENTPEDHHHQRGLFWAWREIYLLGEKIADGWEGHNIRFEPLGFEHAEDLDGNYTLRGHYRWYSTKHDADLPIMDEAVVITLHPDDEHGRRFSVDITLKALVAGLSLGGTPDKGYGGPSVRFLHSEDITIRTKDQAVTAQFAAVETGDAVAFSWPLRPDMPDEIELSCLINGTPWTTWVLRQEKSMQNAAYPGLGSVPVDMDAPLNIRLNWRQAV
ncbi:PmoA family protein [Asticcacaulis sp. ZE23SCel15]|uniref:DUF6807 family protein n=1 Tax=Asticcacaulis sp. ZE23SCel15 TaxID=3059027 RepID=UPI0026602E17|nr:DUF6807 family protein [Asticcacaulis sp. ZE23SCel15]WKL57844.1 PmoA family protein [Asticcacaulis sp. ZE23SCel15]